LALVAVTTETLLVMATPVTAPLLELEEEPAGMALLPEPPQPALRSAPASAASVTAPRAFQCCLFIETPLFIDTRLFRAIIVATQPDARGAVPGVRCRQLNGLSAR